MEHADPSLAADDERAGALTCAEPIHGWIPRSNVQAHPMITPKGP
jgi:hypothetical protein